MNLLVRANVSGSEKFSLMYIGNAIEIRCFKKQTSSQIGFDYVSNGKD